MMNQPEMSLGEEDSDDDMHTDEATVDDSESEAADSSFDSANVSVNLDVGDEYENVAEEVKQRKRSLSDSTHSCSKKQRKCRTSFSRSQLDALEKEFQRSHFITKDRLDHLLASTGLSPVIIKVRLVSSPPAR